MLRCRGAWRPRAQPSGAGQAHACSSGTGFSEPAAPLSGYRQPPLEIVAVVDAPLTPTLSLSPDYGRVLQLYQPPPLPPITELARPELKLAGPRSGALLCRCAASLLVPCLGQTVLSGCLQGRRHAH